MSAAMKALVERPELRRRLVAEPEHIPEAVEEMLRWGSVIMHFHRTAVADTELNGRSIKAVDKVVMWFVSANYDDDHFDDPYRFDAERRPNNHVTFGLHSPHLRLGAHLELRVLFGELLPHIEDVALAGPEERLRSNFIGGIKRLPLTVVWR
jgi:cytochrome P450